MIRVWHCVVVVLASSSAAAQSAMAQAPLTSFSGTTLTLRIGWPPGSGNHIIGRLVADHLGRHLPGQPKIIAQNMPGAASFRLANYMYRIAPKDGTALGYISQTAATEELLGNPAVQFKTAEFGWLGRITSYNMVHVTWHTSKVKTIADALKIESTAGADAVGSTTYNYPFVMHKVLGAKFKMVTGYGGTAATALAMERGEVDGISTGWFTIKSARKDWLDHKSINILFQVLRTRHADLPNVPTMVDLARTPDEKRLFEMYASEGEIGKGIMVPPGVPAPTLAILRDGFMKMTKDPQFVADAERVKVELAPLAGNKLQELIGETTRTPPQTVAWAKSLFR
jgi:tripartite-type tricarboxylate transporter receptor subunit TctC